MSDENRWKPDGAAGEEEEDDDEEVDDTVCWLSRGRISTDYPLGLQKRQRCSFVCH